MQYKMPSRDEWKLMPKIERYQHLTRRKFQEMENKYYSYIDGLTQKLDDIGEIHPDYIPDFTLHTFTFIKDWQYGDVNTQYAYTLLKGMNLADVAEKTVCRRLKNFMMGKERQSPASCEYISAIHDKLKIECVPLYLSYLNMLLKLFEQMVLIDDSQMRLTWIEQVFKKNGEINSRAREITLNQMYREIDNQIIPHNEHKYIVGENIIVFDETLTDEGIACHWIFGPKEYIKHLKTQFKVIEYMNLTEEKNYIKKLIGAFIV
jgi:hypothetical protein